MKFYSAITLASCVSAIVVPNGSAPKYDVDVAVIGGGSAGIHAAVNLQDSGYKVAVIEKEHQVGGHAQTFVNPVTKKHVNIGVALFMNVKSAQQYLGRLKVALATSNPFTALGNLKKFDFTLGIPIPDQTEAQAAETKKAMASAMQAYSQNVLSKYPWIDQGYFIPNPVPEELLMPFGKFAEKYNFSAILPLISQLNWYNGNITTVPALYGVKDFGPGLLQSVSSEFIVTASGDTRDVYVAAAQVLGDSVYLNSEVIKVERKAEGKGVVVVFRQNGKNITLRARKLVVAIPQTRANTRVFDLCEKERQVFTRFKALGYVCGIAQLPDVDNGIQNVGAFTPLNLPLAPGTNGFLPSNSPHDYIVSVGSDYDGFTIADGEALLRENLETLARVGGVSTDAPKKAKFPYLESHAPYFLHITGHDIANGFYSDFLSLEGYRNTYWTGAAFAGHNSALIWNFNDGTVLPAIKKALELETSL